GPRLPDRPIRRTGAAGSGGPKRCSLREWSSARCSPGRGIYARPSSVPIWKRKKQSRPRREKEGGGPLHKGSLLMAAPSGLTRFTTTLYVGPLPSSHRGRRYAVKTCEVSKTSEVGKSGHHSTSCRFT